MSLQEVFRDAIGLACVKVIKSVLKYPPKPEIWTEDLDKYAAGLEVASGVLRLAPPDWQRVTGPPVVALLRRFPNERPKAAIKGWCGLDLKDTDGDLFENYIARLYSYKNVLYIVDLKKDFLFVNNKSVILNTASFVEYFSNNCGAASVYYRRFRPPIGLETCENGYLNVLDRNVSVKSWKRASSTKWVQQELALFSRLIIRDSCDPSFMAVEHAENKRFLETEFLDLSKSMVEVAESLEKAPGTLHAPKGEVKDPVKLYTWQLKGKVPGNMLYYAALANCAAEFTQDQSISKAGFQNTEVLTNSRTLSMDVAALRRSWAHLSSATQALFEQLLEDPIESDTFHTWLGFKNKQHQMCACVIAYYFLSPLYLKYTQKISKLELGVYNTLIAMVLEWKEDCKNENLISKITAIVCGPKPIKKLSEFDSKVHKITTDIAKLVFIPRPFSVQNDALLDMGLICNSVIFKNSDDSYGLLVNGEFYKKKYKGRYAILSNFKMQESKFVSYYYTNFRLNQGNGKLRYRFNPTHGRFKYY